MVPGAGAAKAELQSFMDSRLKNYDGSRNDPNLDALSRMSHWVNYGHISFQRAAITVRALKRHGTDVAAFIEEGVVRREPSDNFCWYTPDGRWSGGLGEGQSGVTLYLHQRTICYGGDARRPLERCADTVKRYRAYAWISLNVLGQEGT